MTEKWYKQQKKTMAEDLHNGLITPQQFTDELLALNRERVNGSGGAEAPALIVVPRYKCFRHRGRGGRKGCLLGQSNGHRFSQWIKTMPLRGIYATLSTR